MEKIKPIELHSHLGSSVNSRELWKLAKLQGINVGVKNIEDFESIINYTGSKNHADYLQQFRLAHKIQSSPLAIMESVYCAIESAYNDGLHGIEIRFNPMLRNQDGYFDLDSLIYHACSGLLKGIDAFGIKAGIIISTDRTFDANMSSILAEKATKFKGLGVIGFDCSGHIEHGETIKNLERAYEIVGEAGLKTTVHTGEVMSDYMVREMSYAIKTLKVDRIGHGVQSISDPYLLNILSDTELCLEICPTSNIHTGVVENWDNMLATLEILHKNEINFTINTDGNVFLKTTLMKEFEILSEKGLSKEILDKCVTNSHKYSFIM